MDDPTVVSICKYAIINDTQAHSTHNRAACASKLFRAVLRYNQRGVGESTGSKSLTGAADCSDIPHMLSFLLQQITPQGTAAQPPDARVWVVGYSWGSCLAAHALTCPWVCGFVGISPPLGGGFSPLGWGARLMLQPLSHLEALTTTTVPCLLVSGTRDQFTPPDVFREQAARLLGVRGDAEVQVPDSALDVQVVHSGVRGEGLLVGAGDHFWGGMWGPLASLVMQWVSSRASGD